MPIQKALEEELREAGWNFRSILLREVQVMSCLGCFKCWDTTPGLCIQLKDEAQGVVEKVIQSELLVFLTPLTFGGFSSELKKIIERFLGLLQPGVTLETGESHHLKRYDRYPSLLACAVTETWDDEEVKIFNRLVDRFSLNFFPPKHRSGVFVAGEDKNKTRGQIQSLIQEMEIGR
ncbi:MAG: NAD(P)H-dependent oxidoreductase [Candidatus Aminicenantes bacterium]|nr:NAD(P)H-dependent oxidoreductase [Candidatus Aminicenantes bacterium]